MKNITYLQNHINKSMNLEDIIEEFCNYFDSQNKFIFETGIYEFTCDEEYLLSLICEEIRMDIIYPPSAKIYDLTSKNEFENADKLKQFVLNSAEYKILKAEPVYKLSIHD